MADEPKTGMSLRDALDMGDKLEALVPQIKPLLAVLDQEQATIDRWAARAKDDGENARADLAADEASIGRLLKAATTAIRLVSAVLPQGE
jgi:hypothetical protein